MCTWKKKTEKKNIEKKTDPPRVATQQHGQPRVSNVRPDHCSTGPVHAGHVVGELMPRHGRHRCAKRHTHVMILNFNTLRYIILLVISRARISTHLQVIFFQYVT